MRHIRQNHHIVIKGSNDKKKLINIGYYHGYKGYRFFRNVNHPLTGIDNFDQIMSIANFDVKVKAAFYPLVMQFENVVKNVIVSQVVKDTDPSFDNIFREKLIYYQSVSRTNRTSYYNAINKRLRLKKIIDGCIANEYSKNNKLVAHYINNACLVPLWALFEIISLGNVGLFMWTLRIEDRIEIARFFDVCDLQHDPDADFIRQAIYIIRDLRNALAHNHIIFDCRFKGNNTRITNNITATIRNKLDLNNNLNFNELFDYLALLIIVLKESGTTKSQLKAYVSTFEDAVNELYKATRQNNLPYSIYNMIIGEDFRNKLSKLKKYISYE